MPRHERHVVTRYADAILIDTLRDTLVATLRWYVAIVTRRYRRLRRHGITTRSPVECH